MATTTASTSRPLFVPSSARRKDEVVDWAEGKDALSCHQSSFAVATNALGVGHLAGILSQASAGFFAALQNEQSEMSDDQPGLRINKTHAENR